MVSIEDYFLHNLSVASQRDGVSTKTIAQQGSWKWQIAPWRYHIFIPWTNDVLLNGTRLKIIDPIQTSFNSQISRRRYACILNFREIEWTYQFFPG